MSQSISRYSDAELEEFRLLIVDRYQKTKEELEDLRAQIMEINENLADEFGQDYMDDSSVATDLEMLNNMSIRKRKYLQELENALIRIKNKTYGVCAITGELIDKARLRAVPTTTKSLLG
ncbi:MAG: TraR/DksA family transcriptional regulator, partial [Lewinella sp.]|nr:TraR/DksA family transcriptional regulator [Lewinella sp.]